MILRFIRDNNIVITVNKIPLELVITITGQKHKQIGNNISLKIYFIFVKILIQNGESHTFHLLFQ